MDDLISRQAAIDALMEILDRQNHAEFMYTDEICKALGELPSAQPDPNCSEIPNNSDTISRQAAIDLVRDVCNVVMSGCASCYDPETEDEVYKDIREIDAILKCNKAIRIALRNMPSAQPQRKKGKWIPVTRIEEWHEEEGLVGFPPEVKEFPQCTIKFVDATEPDEVDGLRCSECDTVYDFTEARNWCSECGADMREPEDIPMEYFENGGR